jgi:hypothetical protein
VALYVETLVRRDVDDLWERTQDPARHERWDARFSRIRYLPRPDPDRPQRFRYAVTVAPGLTVAGIGETAGERRRPDGSGTSALTFWSDDPRSPLRRGSGYWRYVPTADGVRFLTGYDYDVRWGAAGRALDRVALRPLMGWLTAWSFDRLRLWAERGLAPEDAARRWWAANLLRGAGAVAVGGAVAAAARGRWGEAAGRAAAAGLLLGTGTRGDLAPDRLPSAARCRRSPPP